MPAGYSGTPPIKKLGIRSGFRILIVRPPDDYDATLGPLPDEVDRRKRLVSGLDFIHLFAKRVRDLEKDLARYPEALSRDGMLWIFWPKKSSGVSTDVTESIVREMGLATGLVDIKICAVDEIWSGLKFVRRLKNRK